MRFFQNRFVAFVLCALMIAAAFSIASDKQVELVYPLEASGNVVQGTGNHVVTIDLLSGGSWMKFGMATIGIIFFTTVLALLVIAAVIMAIVRKVQAASDRQKQVQSQTAQRNKNTSSKE